MSYQKFNNLLSTRRAEYKAFTSVYCASLKEYITFNSDGFNHLRWHVDGRPRQPAEQMHKLGLLPLVRAVIINAKPPLEYERRQAPIGRKKKDGEKILKDIEYWGLTAVVGKQNVKVKVILRKVGTGKIHFWSVMKMH